MSPLSQGTSPQAAAQPLILLEDVSLRLYGRVLFEHTHWTILGNQHWAVIGPNGSGKSVLMKAICGQVPVIGGQIVYHLGENGSPPQKQVAYVSFDTPERALRREGRFYQARWNIGMYEHTLSVSDYLSEHLVKQTNPFEVPEKPAEPGDFAGLREHVLELLGIHGLLNRELVQLSDGERRKVTLAGALLREPKLLILDGPFSGLDSHYRVKLQDILHRLVEQHMHIVLVTTRQDEVPSHITHALAVRGNRVIAQGPKETILSDHSEPPSLPRDPLPMTQISTSHNRRLDPPILVHMRDVSVSYGDTPILSGIDWTVRMGEHWALLGPNGSGKTTLLSLILGDHPQAYANDITLFGQRRGSGESIWQIKQHIGWVSPELQLYYPKQISCQGVVCSGFFDSVGLFSKCSARRQQEALSWMQQLGVAQHRDKPFSEVSEGEQRIILLARALVKRPLLLVLDEPCQGLDVNNRRRIRQIVDVAASQLDTSTIYVTHDTDELPRIITHLIRLDDGETAYIGRIRDAPWLP
jgi:molybdate transport system ATP-binding protein